MKVTIAGREYDVRTAQMVNGVFSQELPRFWPECQGFEDGWYAAIKDGDTDYGWGWVRGSSEQEAIANLVKEITERDG
jgi:hypothetical protein